MAETAGTRLRTKLINDLAVLWPLTPEEKKQLRPAGRDLVKYFPRHSGAVALWVDPNMAVLRRVLHSDEMCALLVEEEEHFPTGAERVLVLNADRCRVPARLPHTEDSYLQLRTYGRWAPSYWPTPSAFWGLYEVVQGKMTPHWSSALPKNACDLARAWCGTQPDPQTAWDNCLDEEWMEWLLQELELIPEDVEFRDMEDSRNWWDLSDQEQADLVRKKFPTAPELKTT